jgi:hypothetical protein
MARPIKDTPVLYGKSSIYFNQTLAANADNKVTVAEKKAILDIVSSVLKKQRG